MVENTNPPPRCCIGTSKRNSANSGAIPSKMTLSKRQYALNRREAAKKHEEEETKRQEAVSALQNDPLLNKTALSERLGISRRTVQRLAKNLLEDNTTGLEKLLNVSDNRPGKSLVLSLAEEAMICDRLRYCAARGFPVYEDELPEIIRRIANDGRQGYKHGMPTAETVRMFRARNVHRITLRKAQKKETAKLLGEHPAHAETYRDILQDLIKDHPHFGTHPEYLWNMDETDIDGRGRVRKIFCASGAPSTGFESHPTLTNGPHMTCVVTTSPSGAKLPPFYIISGKMVMKRWFNPLTRRRNRTNPLRADIQKYFELDWIPADAGIALSESGSMTIEVLPAYIEHFVRNARKVAQDINLPLLLLLDGHKSRRGIEWIQLALQNNIEIVQSPANTSHYLQSNDQDVNLIMNRVGKTVRDILVQESDISPTNINFKLVKGTHGYNAITEDVVKASWRKTGLWPMDYRFVQFARDAWDGQAARRAESEPLIDLTVQVRESDLSIVTRLSAIVNNAAESPERRLQQAAVLLNNSSSTNRILMDIEPGSASPAKPATKNYAKKPPKGAGAAAVYLTSQDYIDAFETKRKEDEQKELEKEQRKVAREKRAAEKAQKEAEKAQSKKRRVVGGASSAQ